MIKYFLLSGVTVFMWVYFGVGFSLLNSAIIGATFGILLVSTVMYLEYKSYMAFLKHCKDCIFILPLNPDDGSQCEVPREVIAYHVPQSKIRKKREQLIQDLIKAGNPFWTDPDLEEGKRLPVISIPFRKGVRVNDDYIKDYTPFSNDRIRDIRSAWHRILEEKDSNWYFENWLKRI